MRILAGALFVCASFADAYGQTIGLKEACKRFSPAIVSIRAGAGNMGTGFLVSKTGIVATATHVIMDETAGEAHSAIALTLSNGKVVFADPLEALSPKDVANDVVLLKIHPADLPSLSTITPLDLEESNSFDSGSPEAIIGFPFSAVPKQGSYVTTKFCLSATVAATEVDEIPVIGKDRNTGYPMRLTFPVDVVYFQGPSVKGVSGSPLIDLSTGHVIGVVSTKLAGIDQGLSEARRVLASVGSSLTISGPMGTVAPEAVQAQVIDTLDRHLANGLGSATGVRDALKTLRRQKR